MKADEIAASQGIPSRFLAQLLADPRRADLVCRGRGYSGGYWLAVAPADITVADIARVIDGPLADVHGVSPEQFGPPGVAAPTRDLWVAVRAALRSVMEQVTSPIWQRAPCRPRSPRCSTTRKLGYVVRIRPTSLGLSDRR